MDLEDASLADVYRFIRSSMSREFSFMRGDIKFSTLLSLTSLQLDQFNWQQRMPHTDPGAGTGRANYAALLYLFENPRLGGTGFYRWKDEAFLQTIVKREEKDPEKAMRMLMQRFPEFAGPPQFITESTDFAELQLMVPARFNRLIFYSGDIPHSAYITNPELLTEDLSSGRLTLNVFASVRPK